MRIRLLKKQVPKLAPAFFASNVNPTGLEDPLGVYSLLFQQRHTFGCVEVAGLYGVEVNAG